ncbi:MAG: hypothetical protein N2444_07940, partial [Methylocystis sp.]|nr:hypothetical protein [Methylocystis sp.]
RRGDQVDVRVKLVHLKGNHYDIPHDETTHLLLDDWFFLKQRGVGYSTPLATTRYVKPLLWLRPVNIDEGGQTYVSYRSPWDFVTPFPGLYAWLIEGTLRRRGRDPVTFTEKFVSAQPRIPYGPAVVHAHDVDLNTLMGAPEGWFEAVRPANGGGQPHAASARTSHSSPTVSEIMGRQRRN